MIGPTQEQVDAVHRMRNQRAKELNAVLGAVENHGCFLIDSGKGQAADGFLADLRNLVRLYTEKSDPSVGKP